MRRPISIEVLSSIVGKGLTAGLLILFTPIYISYLGVESYGLISFYATLLAVCLLLDQSVSPVVTRQFAHRSGDRSIQQRWNTLRTLETIAVCIGVIIAFCIFIAAPWIAAHLLRASSISSFRLETAVRLMALMLAAQWPSFMYAAAFAGLGDQTTAAAIRSTISIAQWVGGAAILAKGSATIEALFSWHALCLFTQSVLLRRYLVRALPEPVSRPRWSGDVLRGSWRFSVGTLIVGITGTILTQADKLLVSQNTPLAEFAAYTLTFNMASLISVMVVQPVMTIAYPYFARLTSEPEQTISREYRRWTQFVVTVTVPLVGALIFFGDTIQAFWLGPNAAQFASTTRYLPWVALGTLLNVVMMLPFTLQLAYGWTALSATKNLIVTPFFLMLLIFGVPRWGAIVGAIAWLTVNLSYYLFEVPLTHRRLLRGLLSRWWLLDTLFPCVGGLGLFWAAKKALWIWSSSTINVGECIGITVIVGSTLGASLPLVRASVWSMGQKLLSLRFT